MKGRQTSFKNPQLSEEVTWLCWFHQLKEKKKKKMLLFFCAQSELRVARAGPPAMWFSETSQMVAQIPWVAGAEVRTDNEDGGVRVKLDIS